MKRIIQGLVLSTLISTAQASPNPANGDDPIGGPSPEWTYADRHAGEGNMQLGSAFPAGDETTGPAVEWTYADRHAGEGDMQLGSAFPLGDDVSGPVPLPTSADRFATDRAQHAGSAIK